MNAMQFDSFDEMFNHIKNHLGVQHNKKKVLVNKATPQEISKFQELHSRKAALKKDVDRATSKIESDRGRLWADLMDKHNAHGKNLHYDSGDGCIYEMVEERELSEGG